MLFVMKTNTRLDSEFHTRQHGRRQTHFTVILASQGPAPAEVPSWASLLTGPDFKAGRQGLSPMFMGEAQRGSGTSLAFSIMRARGHMLTPGAPMLPCSGPRSSPDRCQAGLLLSSQEARKETGGAPTPAQETPLPECLSGMGQCPVAAPAPPRPSLPTPGRQPSLETQVNTYRASGPTAGNHPLLPSRPGLLSPRPVVPSEGLRSTLVHGQQAGSQCEPFASFPVDEKGRMLTWQLGGGLRGGLTD